MEGQTDKHVSLDFYQEIIKQNTHSTLLDTDDSDKEDISFNEIDGI